MSISDLPAVNACLNSLSAIFLTAGYIQIKRNHQIAHRNCMIAALITSTLFLVCYLTYHYLAPGMTRFQGQGWVRPVYFGILLTHTILAMAIVPMVLVSLYFALRQRFESHRKIARWTWPIWMYVSVTGVIIYLLLYQIYPSR
ncbi:MAG: DUF420 domain-containing protein [Verrucomicrobiota bacterium]